MSGREDEEEDLGTAMQKIPIPVNVFDKEPIDLDRVFGFADGVREIIEDSNLLVSFLQLSKTCFGFE